MSPRQLAAQAANAKLSTGPRTEAGRTRSSQNSARHYLTGKKYLVSPERGDEFDRHHNLMLEALAPEGAIECQLAEAIILDQYRLSRARRLEDQIFIQVESESRLEFLAEGEAWLAHSKQFALITLYEQRIHRALTRNKAELEARQTARKAAKPAESTPRSNPRNPLKSRLNLPPMASFIRAPNRPTLPPPKLPPNPTRTLLKPLSKPHKYAINRSTSHAS